MNLFPKQNCLHYVIFITLSYLVTPGCATVPELHKALRSADTKTAEKLIQGGANFEAQDKYKQRPLYIAVGSSSLESTRLLLEKGAKVDGRNTEEKSTALMRVSQRNKFVENLKKMSWEGKLKVKARYLDNAKLLISHGANVNLKDKDQWTAFHFAALNEDKELCEVLLKAGSKVEKIKDHSKVPVQVTARASVKALKMAGDIYGENGNKEKMLTLYQNTSKVLLTEINVAKGMLAWVIEEQKKAENIELTPEFRRLVNAKPWEYHNFIAQGKLKAEQMNSKIQIWREEVSWLQAMLEEVRIKLESNR